MTTIEKIIELERMYGGPVKAASAAGVSYPVWFRWRTGRRGIAASVRQLIDILHETKLHQFPSSAPPEARREAKRHAAGQHATSSGEDTPNVTGGQ